MSCHTKCSMNISFPIPRRLLRLWHQRANTGSHLSLTAQCCSNGALAIGKATVAGTRKRNLVGTSNNNNLDDRQSCPAVCCLSFRGGERHSSLVTRPTRCCATMASCCFCFDPIVKHFTSPRDQPRGMPWWASAATQLDHEFTMFPKHRHLGGQLVKRNITRRLVWLRNAATNL